MILERLGWTTVSILVGLTLLGATPSQRAACSEVGTGLAEAANLSSWVDDSAKRDALQPSYSQLDFYGSALAVAVANNESLETLRPFYQQFMLAAEQFLRTTRSLGVEIPNLDYSHYSDQARLCGSLFAE